MYYTAATVNQFQAEGWPWKFLLHFTFFVRSMFFIYLLQLLDQNLQSDLESIKKERMTHQSGKRLPVS